VTARLDLPDALGDDCAIRMVLDRISDRWSVLLLAALNEGAVRFSDLRRTFAELSDNADEGVRMKAISQKMLTQTLRALERDGLVERRIYAEVPARVEYDLTALGRSLATSVAEVAAWADAHGDAIVAARERYDAVEHPPVQELHAARSLL
jgi:DNA-binding HxlR family transcriptional regulator